MAICWLVTGSFCVGYCSDHGFLIEVGHVAVVFFSPRSRILVSSFSLWSYEFLSFDLISLRVVLEVISTGREFHNLIADGTKESWWVFDEHVISLSILFLRRL